MNRSFLNVCVGFTSPVLNSNFARSDLKLNLNAQRRYIYQLSRSISSFNTSTHQSKRNPSQYSPYYHILHTHIKQSSTRRMLSTPTNPIMSPVDRAKSLQIETQKQKKSDTKTDTKTDMRQVPKEESPTTETLNFKIRFGGIELDPDRDPSKPQGTDNKFKDLAQKYGWFTVAVHLNLSLVSLVGWYFAFKLHIDVHSVLSFFGLQNSISETTGALGAAYLVHKATSPIRMAITVATVGALGKYDMIPQSFIIPFTKPPTSKRESDKKDDKNPDKK